MKEILAAMAQYEEEISALYASCAERWPESDELWLTMSKDEVVHAERLRWLSRILEENPRQFEIGRPFNRIAINTAISGVKKHREEIKNGSYAPERAMAIARDIEQSILESRYMEFLKTSNVEYQETMKRLVEETGNHRKIIQQYLEKITE
ncbi:MAG TPA: hypothetical protein PLG80_00060 [Syntrophales bacterium]|nr:hypothetical protein [Syntrophales bacterium]